MGCSFLLDVGLGMPVSMGVGDVVLSGLAFGVRLSVLRVTSCGLSYRTSEEVGGMMLILQAQWSRFWKAFLNKPEQKGHDLQYLQKQLAKNRAKASTATGTE